MTETQQTYSRILVLDTSFLIARAQGHHWTFEPFNVLKNQDSAVVIPQGVEHEFERTIKDGSREIGAPDIDKLDIFGVLNKQKFVSYDTELRGILAQRLEHRPKYYGYRYKPLSKVDKTVIQAALDATVDGIPVFVVSGDEGIVNQVREINLIERLDIGHYSPWRIPVAQPEVKLLLTEESYHQLKVMHPDSNKKYLAVARGMHIGGNVSYDIAFAVYSDTNAIVFPRIDNSYFIRIYQYGVDNLKFSFADSLPLLAVNIIPIYFGKINVLHLIGNKSPLTKTELDMTRLRLKSRRITQKDMQHIDSAASGIAQVKWAMISRYDLRRHDAVTAGRLEELVRELSKS